MTGTFNQLLTHEIQDLASAEDQILAALPSLVKQADDGELKQALQSHLEETKSHKERLHKVAKDLDVKLDGVKCKGISGILAEGKDLVDQQWSAEVRDAAIIASAQRVEHYEMAAYGTAAHFARLLGQKRAADQLTATLDEEKRADATLTRIADSRVNQRAVKSH